MQRREIKKENFPVHILNEVQKDVMKEKADNKKELSKIRKK